MDITEAYIEDTGIHREPECNESYQPFYDHDPCEYEPEKAEMEPILHRRDAENRRLESKVQICKNMLQNTRDSTLHHVCPRAHYT